MKTFRIPALAAAIAATGLVLAACGSGGTTAATETETVTVTAEADAPADDTAPADNPAGADANAPAPADADAADAADSGARCALSAGTEAIVVQGPLDCAIVDAAWNEAIADPGFADRSRRVAAGDFLCRAHQTQPIQTGFCETDGEPYAGFKVIRGAGGHHGGMHGGPHGGMHHGGR